MGGVHDLGLDFAVDREAERGGEFRRQNGAIYGGAGVCFQIDTVFLELVEELVILHETTLEALFVEAGAVEIADLVEVSAGIGDGDGHVGIGIGGGVRVGLIHETESVGIFLIGGGAGEAPGVADDAVGDLQFLFAGGVERGGEALGEREESAVLLRCDYGELAGEGVLNGVESRDGLTFGGARAGGVLRVKTVGVDLLL